MQKQIFQEIPLHLRESEIRDNCNSVIETEYKKVFSPEELQDKEKQYTKESAALFRLQAEYKAEIKAMNETLKAKRKALNELLVVIDNGFENQKGQLFLFDDQEEGYMYSYDSQGELVEQRRLRPNERQAFIPFRKAANEE